MKTYFKLMKMNFVQMFREPIIIIVTLGFPLIFVLIFGMMYSGNENVYKYEVGVVLEDSSELSNYVVDAFEEIDIFNVSIGLEDEELSKLDENKRDIVIILEKGLEEKFIQGQTTEIDILYSKEANYINTQLLISNVFSNIENGYKGQVNNLIPQYIDINKSEQNKPKELDLVMPSLLAIFIMQAGLFGCLKISEMKESGTFRSFGVTPLSKPILIGSELTVRLIICLIQGIIVLGLGSLLFDVNIILANLPIVAGWVVLGGVAFSSLGYAIAAWTNTFEGTNGVVQIIQMSLMFLSGILIPIEMFPEFIRWVVKINPVYYLSDALSSSSAGVDSINGVFINVTVLLVVTIISTLLAMRYRWD